MAGVGAATGVGCATGCGAGAGVGFAAATTTGAGEGLGAGVATDAGAEEMVDALALGADAKEDFSTEGAGLLRWFASICCETAWRSCE